MENSSVVRELTRPLALVIEDNQVVIDFLEVVISQMGFKVVSVRDAESALEVYKKKSSKTSFIVLDYGIPGMHSARLVNEFVMINPSAKILLASGYSKSFVLKDFPIEKVEKFVTKPFLPNTLIENIENMLQP